MFDLVYSDARESVRLSEKRKKTLLRILKLPIIGCMSLQRYVAGLCGYQR